MSGFVSDLISFFRRFCAQSRGNVTVIVALSIIPVSLAIGGGVDFSNVITARARLQDAADSAAIAAALDTTGTLTTQKAEAQTAFTGNITGQNLSNATGTLTVTTVNNVQTMNYSATATVPTVMLQLIGMSSVSISAVAKAGVSINSAEIAFVLDNTGSMSSNNKMTSLKSSLDSVLASLLDSSGTNSGRTKVALVPFDTQVALKDVANMTGYATNFGTVSPVYSCTSLGAAQCSAITSNDSTLCAYITTNYGSTAGTTCAANQANYTRTSGGYLYVYTSTWILNPNYVANCWHYCTNASYYMYLTYYREAVYSLGTSTATQVGGDNLSYFLTNWASPIAPTNNYYIWYGYLYSPYSGTITYTVPSAGGISSGSTTVIKDNDTITSNDDLLGVSTTTWTGCVIDRVQPYDVQSDAPTTSNASTLYPASKCATNSLLPIKDLTTDIAAVRTYAAGMTPAGNTNITIGVQWGMEVLSNTPPFSNGAAFTDKTVNKYMIVLTDGVNTQNRWTTTSSSIDARTTLACTNAKALGITVFTIRLENGNSTMLSGCASKTDYYYNLTSATQINGALGSIMKSIKKIRLTQ